jgi:hypothetical protein
VIFTNTTYIDMNIKYDYGSKGSIVNSKFIDINHLDADNVVYVAGAVDIDNTEFRNLTLVDSALYYADSGSGDICNSVFIGNNATDAASIRNINAGRGSGANFFNNTYDVIMIYSISNDRYGSSAVISGTFDAGVNFNVPGVKLTVNDTAGTNGTVTIDRNQRFSWDVSGKIDAGTYNLTASATDGNKYIIDAHANLFEITRANVTINDIESITVRYGDNDTVTVSGTITSNIVAGKSYTGNLSIIIADNDAVTCVVNEDGTFSADVIVKQFNVGVYALNVTVVGNNNYNGTSKKFDTYLTVIEATISPSDVDRIVVDYGADYVIVNGTLNSTKFGVNYTGEITVTIAGLSNSSHAKDGNFSVRISNATPFRVGHYAITVSGEAIDNYNAIAAKTFDDKLEVLAIDPEFSIASPSIGYGENATVYIYLPADATGRVFINASNKYFVNIDDIYGITNATIVLPVSGSYEINATYYGDNNYRKVSANSTLFVERPRTAIGIDVDDVFVGSDVLINFTINSAVTGSFYHDAFGSMRVYVGSKLYNLDVKDGKANLTVPNLAIGNYSIVVIYAGDENYAGSDAFRNFLVNGYVTDLIITLDSYEALVG